MHKCCANLGYDGLDLSNISALGEHYRSYKDPFGGDQVPEVFGTVGPLRLRMQHGMNAC